MKNLIITILLSAFAMLTTACGGSGGGGNGGGVGHVPDTSEHDYSVIVAALTNTNQPHAVDLHQVCDFGYSDVRDESASFVLQDPSISTGVGCDDAQNYIFEVVNNSTDSVYVVVTVDGIDQPQEEVLAGETFTFTRGY